MNHLTGAANPLCHQAPISTFDGTLIDDMSFGTLRAQVLSTSNLPMRRADNPRFSNADFWHQVRAGVASRIGFGHSAAISGSGSLGRPELNCDFSSCGVNCRHCCGSQTLLMTRAITTAHAARTVWSVVDVLHGNAYWVFLLCCDFRPAR